MPIACPPFHMSETSVRWCVILQFVSSLRAFLVGWRTELVKGEFHQLSFTLLPQYPVVQFLSFSVQYIFLLKFIHVGKCNMRDFVSRGAIELFCHAKRGTCENTKNSLSLYIFCKIMWIVEHWERLQNAIYLENK